MYAPRAPVPDTPLWALWDSLHRLFPMWWFLVSASTSAWRRFSGFDSLRRLRLSPRVVKAVALLDMADDATLDDLIALARVNVDRQGYFARTILFAYVSIPISIGAIFAQLQPALLQAWLIDYAPSWAGTLAGLGVAVLIRLTLDGQARQFLAMLEIARIERGGSDRISPADAARKPV